MKCGGPNVISSITMKRRKALNWESILKKRGYRIRRFSYNSVKNTLK
jgi:hypothetical protein